MRTDLRRCGNAIWFTLAALAAVISGGASLGIPGFAGVTAVVVVAAVLSPLVTIFLVVACLANGVALDRLLARIAPPVPGRTCGRSPAGRGRRARAGQPYRTVLLAERDPA